MNITYEDYIRPMVPFLKSLPDALRTCEDVPSLKFYGTGDTGHWAVQSNQQVMSAIAVLSDTPDIEKYGSPYSTGELRELALSMLRYSLRTHVTGDLNAVDGKRWGRHWISVLGFERGVMGLNILAPYMTDDDKSRLRALDIFEADYRYNDYPIEAAIDASTGRNKPESNIWNAGFLFRAAANYPDAPNCAGYIEKATRMMLAGLSFPDDATSDELFLGRPLREWFTGPNFTENWSLDHHHYMNVGYAFVCLSNIACLYYNFRERGQEIPPCLLHNVERLWNVVKRFIFPDGRMIRVGGDSRSRYNYCQNFAQQAYLLAADLFGDEDAIRYEKGFIGIIEREQNANGDGSFFGKRLSKLKDESYYFYRRLEADPFFALGCGAYWRHKFCFKNDAPDLPSPHVEPAYSWNDKFHSAAFIRTGNTVRSITRAAHTTPVPTRQFYSNVDSHGWAPNAICAPLDRSDTAEWANNLISFIGLRLPEFKDTTEYSATEKSFRWTTTGDVWEKGPTGEGENPMAVGKRTLTIEALPDGKTMVFADKFTMSREYTLVHGFRTMHFLVPNDVYNGYSRIWTGDGFSFRTDTEPGEVSLVKTGKRILNVDNSISVFAILGGDLNIYREAGQNIMLYNTLTSIYADEICMDCELKPRRLKAGETAFNVVYAVSADTTLAEALAVPNRAAIIGEGQSREVVFTGFDGADYTISIPE